MCRTWCLDAVCFHLCVLPSHNLELLSLNFAHFITYATRRKRKKGRKRKRVKLLP
jgi:hypothetical protein